MKKSALLGLSLATALLTACGGGGGSSNPTPMVNNNGSGGNSGNNNGGTTVVGTTTNNNAQTNTDKLDTTIQGNLLNLNNATAKRANNSATTTAATTDKNIVVVNGQKLTFMQTGISSNAINMDATNMARTGGSSNLQYTRYGYLREGSNAPVLFAQGNLAEKMPTSGEATYTGQSAHVHNGNVELRNAKFSVNYAAKTVTGKIGTDINLSAKINGNTFSGQQGIYTTDGKFYGPNAEEMGGVYKNTTGNISGAFGAKK